MEAKIEQVTVQLQQKVFEINNQIAPELYQSTMNAPIVICWPKAMKYYRRDDFMAVNYPKAARVKKFGVISHRDLFKRAHDLSGNVNILNTRSFGGEAREIWRQDQRMQELCRILLKNALDKSIDPSLGEFQIYDTFRVSFMKVRREFKLGAFDTATNTNGILMLSHKKVVKEAVYKAMEDLRYLCRARNVPRMYAVATNVYEWQFVYYDRDLELQSKDTGEMDFFQLSPVYKLYVKEKNYTYGDNELKTIISLLRQIALKVINDAKTFKAQLIVPSSCIPQYHQTEYIITQ